MPSLKYSCSLSPLMFDEREHGNRRKALGGDRGRPVRSVSWRRPANAGSVSVRRSRSRSTRTSRAD